jgi:hypothetical protein
MSFEQLQQWLPLINGAATIVFLIVTLTSTSLLQAMWRGAICASIFFTFVAVLMPMPNVGPWRLEVLIGTVVLAAAFYGAKELVVRLAGCRASAADGSASVAR